MEDFNIWQKKTRPTKPCALCHQVKELEESHIIPKFVVRHLKKTSFGAIRSLNNPNKVVQDSEKHYMLCGDCEDLFSAYETKFANTFFYPYQKDGVIEFEYDEDIYYFLTSVSWRSLYQDILDFIENYEEIGVTVEVLNCLVDREQQMGNYLTKTIHTLSGIEHHIFFFDDIKEFINKPDGIKPHTDIKRGELSYTFFDKKLKTFATITNMMGIMLFTLYSKGVDEYWENTEIFNSKGTIKAEKQKIRSVCGGELIEIFENTKKRMSMISDVQKKNITDKVINNKKDFINSEAYEALKKDFNL